ncbi:MAG: hypothetical protein LBS82_04290 [Spirochaetaceae bacterium]|jgi:hypothetical protein|nr:hypothetical protein [Spirochaetaceae bacterium]
MFDAPTVSIADVKKSPVEIFELASRNKNAVYVSNRATVVGVMLTNSHYDELDGSQRIFVDKALVGKTCGMQKIKAQKNGASCYFS